MKYLFDGYIKNKIVYVIEKLKFNNYLETLEGKEIELTIGLKRKNRSSNENKYYWGVIIRILADEFGYSDDEMHSALKYKFLKIHEDKLLTVRSTTDLSTVEFEKYCSEIRQWASEQSILIPLPNEVLLEEK